MLIILIHFVASSISSFRLVCYPMTHKSQLTLGDGLSRSTRFCQSKISASPKKAIRTYSGGAIVQATLSQMVSCTLECTLHLVVSVYGDPQISPRIHFPHL
ncbi:hypothetical protein F5Y02DRAFT_365951 [Annulohypoxylon stygium]|nr:hypothetical protein F5Y02DRAFT_365951 [Annulohypoxylon stygium]